MAKASKVALSLAHLSFSEGAATTAERCLLEGHGLGLSGEADTLVRARNVLVRHTHTRPPTPHTPLVWRLTWSLAFILSYIQPSKPQAHAAPRLAEDSILEGRAEMERDTVPRRFEAATAAALGGRWARVAADAVNEQIIYGLSRASSQQIANLCAARERAAALAIDARELNERVQASATVTTTPPPCVCVCVCVCCGFGWVSVGVCCPCVFANALCGCVEPNVVDFKGQAKRQLPMQANGWAAELLWCWCVRHSSTHARLTRQPAPTRRQLRSRRCVAPSKPRASSATFSRHGHSSPVVRLSIDTIDSFASVVVAYCACGASHTRGGCMTGDQSQQR